MAPTQYHIVGDILLNTRIPTHATVSQLHIYTRDLCDLHYHGI